MSAGSADGRFALHFRATLIGVLLLLSLLYLVEAFSFKQLASYAPIVAGAMACAGLGVALVRELLRIRRAARGDHTQASGTIETSGEGPVTRKDSAGGLKYMLLALAYAVSLIVFGIYVSSALFIIYVLSFDIGMSRTYTAVATLAVMVSLYVVEYALQVVMPHGLLF